MNQCVQLEGYLNKALASDRQVAFTKHLEHCSDCCKQVDQWNQLKDAIRHWGDSKELPQPMSSEAAELVVQLKPRGLNIFKPKWPVYVAVASAACVLAVFVVLFQGSVFQGDPEGIPTFQKQTPIRVLYSDNSEFQQTSDTSGQQLSVPEEGRLVFGLGPDSIGLASKTSVEVLTANSDETRIELHKGSIFVAVEPLTRKRSFVVVAGNTLVRVVGTRFGVSFDSVSDVRVAVEKGKVSVADPKEALHDVEKDQVLTVESEGNWRMDSLSLEEKRELNELLIVPVAEEMLPVYEEDIDDETIDSGSGSVDSKVKSRPTRKRQRRKFRGSPATWRQWILNGEYSRAEKALVDHLGVFPSDTKSWLLLANCRRKARNWNGAVNAYRQVIEHGNPKAASSARFNAAVLLQDKLGKYSVSADLLSDYLEAPRLLEAEAMVRLARSRIKQGRKTQAMRLLNQVLERYNGTSSAIQARRLLADLGKPQ